MRKKTLLYLLLAGFVLAAAAAATGYLQFKGNAVGEQYELYVLSLIHI